MSQRTPGQELRDAIDGGAIQVPGAPNALLARMIEQNEFQAAYLSGAAFSAGQLALPDVGLFSLTELAQETARITRRIDIPLIVDADTGFGDTANVERTIEELEAAGAAAIQLEDQQLPKRCGHLSGKSLVETDVMVAKIKAAVAARRDPSLVIIARTDARGVTDLDDCLDRSKRYLDAGADWIFPEALADESEFQRVADELDAPLVANMTEFGKSPLLSLAELDEIGFSVVLYPVTLLRVAMKAAEAVLQSLAFDGTQEELVDLMQSRAELYELLGYEDYEQRDRDYFSK